MMYGSEETLKKAAQSGNFLPCYIVFGDDAYLKKLRVKNLTEKITGGEDVLDFVRFGNGCDLRAVFDAKEQFPMLADKKCVILDDYDFESANEADFSLLCELLSDSNENAVLILTFDSLDFDPKKSSKFTKLTEACEKGGGMAVQINHKTGAELERAVLDAVKKRGGVISGDTVRYFIQTVSDDLNIIIGETEKLCAYSGGKEITKETVDKVSVRTVEESVYVLSSKILACDVNGALSALDDLYFMRVKPMIIIYNLTSAYLDMYRVFVGKKAKMQLPDIARDFGYGKRDFVLKRVAGDLKKFSETSLRASLGELLKADRKLKSFSGDTRTELEQLAVRLIYIMKNGESVD